MTANAKFENLKVKNPLNTISIVYFRYPRLFTEKFSRTIYPGIFGGRTPCADSVSPRMNTIESRDQFEPISIGENFAVNYNSGDFLKRNTLLNFYDR